VLELCKLVRKSYRMSQYDSFLKTNLTIYRIGFKFF